MTNDHRCSVCGARCPAMGVNLAAFHPAAPAGRPVGDDQPCPKCGTAGENCPLPSSAGCPFDPDSPIAGPVGDDDEATAQRVTVEDDAFVVDGPRTHDHVVVPFAFYAPRDTPVDQVGAVLRAALASTGSGPCPYVVTSDEGTSYCSLAESGALASGSGPARPTAAQVAAVRDSLTAQGITLDAVLVEALLVDAAGSGPADPPSEEPVDGMDPGLLVRALRSFAGDVEGAVTDEEREEAYSLSSRLDIHELVIVHGDAVVWAHRRASGTPAEPPGDPSELVDEVASLLRGMAVDHPDASPKDVAYAIVHGPLLRSEWCTSCAAHHPPAPPVPDEPPTAAPTDERCTGTLGSRPEWMSPDQYDPCRCDLKVGHPADLTDERGGHWCEHLDVPCPDGWLFDATAAALREDRP